MAGKISAAELAHPSRHSPRLIRPLLGANPPRREAGSNSVSPGDRVALWRFYFFTFYRPKTNSIEAVDVFFSSGL
jgi:hypothetical protein